MPSLQEKKTRILEYEEGLAKRLARRVIEKPIPPIWMILIPVFFVFYALKLKEYSQGLKKFASHYLFSRRRALDAACEAVQRQSAPEIDGLMPEAGSLPPEAVPLYRDWMKLLTDHYMHLLRSDGGTAAEMIRAHYHHKSSYLLFTDQLNRTENTFNQSLLPGIEGDRRDILYITERLQRGSEELRRMEVEAIFS